MIRFFDQDGNDQISSVELSEALTKLGESPEDGDIDFIMAVVDEDNDAQLNFEEFLQLMLPEEVDTGYSEPNGQWFHDQLEIALILFGKSPSADDLNAMVSEVDEDGNGNIELSEFDSRFERVFEHADDYEEANQQQRHVFQFFLR